MIHLKVFCPYERVFSILNNLAYENGTQKLTVQFNETSLRSVDVTKPDIDRALGFTIDERLKFMKADVIHLKAWFDSSEYAVIVKNVLLTDSPVPYTAKYGKESVTNATLADGETSVCCPEALETTGFDATPGQYKVGEVPIGVRPFYQYVLESIDRNMHEIVIKGPSNCIFKYRPYSSFKNKLGSFSLLEEGSVDDIQVVTKLNSPSKSRPTATQGQYLPVTVVLKYNEGTTPFVFGQKVMTIDGKKLSCRATALILKTVCLIELSKLYNLNLSNLFADLDYRDGSITIPVQEFNGYYQVAPEYQAKILPMITNNYIINGLFDDWFDADESILFRSGDRYSELVSLKNGNCFFFAFTAMLTVGRGLPLVCMVELMNKMIREYKYVRITDDNVIEGVTAGMDDVTYDLEISRVRIAGIRRKLISRDEFEVGDIRLCGININGDTGNVPNHYVLAQRTSRDMALIVYDPRRDRATVDYESAGVMSSPALTIYDLQSEFRLI